MLKFRIDGPTQQRLRVRGHVVDEAGHSNDALVRVAVCHVGSSRPDEVYIFQLDLQQDG